MFLFRDVTWYKYLVRFSNTFLKCHYGFNDFFSMKCHRYIPHSVLILLITLLFYLRYICTTKTQLQKKTFLANVLLKLVNIFMYVCFFVIIILMILLVLPGDILTNPASCSRNSNSFFFCYWNLDSFPDNSFIKMSYCKLTTQYISLILSVYQKPMQTTVILINQADFGVI